MTENKLLTATISRAVFFLSLALATGCSPKWLIGNKRQLHQMVQRSRVFNDHFTGFVLYDPQTKKVLYDQLGDKYFTPASNTKLFTFYAGLRLLGDSIPALKYAVLNDTLYFTGTGDPTFLHPDFDFQPAYELLADTSKVLVWQPEVYNDAAFGPGWSWDDYYFYYQPERAGLPLFGNVARFYMLPGDSVPAVTPPFFQEFVETRPFDKDRYLVERDISFNSYLFFRPESADTVERDVPFRYSFALARQLLQDTLRRPVIFGYKPDGISWKILSGYPSKEVYQAMLQPSDNFLAEQILIMGSSHFGDTLSSGRAIGFIKKNYLEQLPDEPVWHDGSGLSRYNMFTPRSIVALLTEIGDMLPQEELFRTLPTGGKSGTIKRWYAGSPEPYVFAKTGTLSGVHCLSGYLRCTSGKVLVFSFMHNNYPGFTTPIREEMERVLEFIRDSY